MNIEHQEIKPETPCVMGQEEYEELCMLRLFANRAAKNSDQMRKNSDQICKDLNVIFQQMCILRKGSRSSENNCIIKI